MVKKKVLLDTAVIFISALVLRLLFMLIMKNNPVLFFGGDTKNYCELANNLLAHGTFVIDKISDPGIFRTPGYPAFIAFIYSKFGVANNLPVVMFQVVLSSISCVLLYMALGRLFPRWVALTGTFLYACDIPSVYYANKILTETLFTLIFICFTLVFSLFFEKKRIVYLILSAILLGATVLTRPATYYLIFLLIFLFAYYFKTDLKKGLRQFAIFALIYMCVVMPWVLRNYIVSGYWGISAVKELNLCNFKGAWIEMKLNKDDDIYRFQNLLAQKVDRELRKKGLQDTAANRARMRGLIGKEILTAYPGLLASYQAIHTLDVLFSTGMDLAGEVLTGINAKELTEKGWFIFADTQYSAYLVMLYLFVTVGLFAALKKDRIYTFLPWLVIMLYMLAIHGEFDGRSRFRVPLMPLIIVFFCLGLTEVYKRMAVPKKLTVK